MANKQFNKQSNAVTSIKQNNDYYDYSKHYKPSRNYDNGEDYKIPDSFKNKHGKFDTSLKLINLSQNNWRSNRNFERITHKINNKNKLNAKGKNQGDYKKHEPRQLPKLVFKTTLKPVKELEEDEVGFWLNDYKEAPENDKRFIEEEQEILPKYYQFLRDDLQQDNLGLSFKSALINGKKSIKDLQQEKLGLSSIEATYDIVSYDEIPNQRTTQGLVYLSYIGDAISAIGGAFGTYYTYKIVYDLISALTAVTKTPSFMSDFIKNYVGDIIVVLVTFAKYYNGSFNTLEAFSLLTGYAFGKQYLTSIIETIKQFFTQLVPAQSSIRHTQGVDTTTFAQGVIALIGVFFLGTNYGESFSSKSVLNSVKSLGSSLLTIKTLEGVICEIVTALPDVLMSILCERFPVLALYVHVSTDGNFKRFLDKVVEFYNMKKIHILYNSHNLSKFLELYKYMKDYVMSDDNLDRGMGQLLNDYIDWFDDVYETADKMGLLPGKRRLPFVIWLSGDPGVGKSTLAKDMANNIIRERFSKEIGEEIDDDDISNFVYTFATNNKYVDGYNNQPVFILNDYLQFSTEEEEQWLIRFVDTIDTALEVSSVDNKDQGIKGEVRFTSRIIIVTSNVTYLNSSKNIVNVEAMNRRRDLLINMDWKNDETNINFDNFDYSWANFRFINPLLVHSQRPAYATCTDINEFYNHIYSKLDSFLVRNNQVLEFTGIMKKENVHNLNNKMILFDTKKSSFTSILQKIKDIASKVLNTKLLSYKNYAIYIKDIIPLCLGGTALYVAYKTYMSYFLSKITQSLSGDVSTRKFAPERRPLKRYTMGNSQNVQDMCNIVTNNVVTITTYIHSTDGKLIKQTMNGFYVGGSLLVTPKHLWVRGDNIVEEGSKVTIIYKDITYDILLDKKNLFFDENRDIACLNTCHNLPLSRSVEHLLLNEGCNINHEGEDSFLILNNNKNTIMTPVKAYIRDAPYYDPFGARFDGKEIWQYNIKTVQGNCGSILLIALKDKLVIGGIHVAGDYYSGNSEVLDTLFMQQAKQHFERKTQGFATDAEYDTDEYFDAMSDFDDGFVFLGKSKRAPYQNNKTEIVKGPLYEVLQPVMTGPAVLQPSDPRLEDNTVSPILKSVSRYGDYIVPFDNKLMTKAYYIVKSFYDCMESEKFEVHNYNDSINSKYTPSLEKLDLKTSAGYPWNVNRKSKKDLISNINGELYIKEELNNRLNTCDNLLKKKTMFPYTLTTTLKDERIALDKIKIGKTRTFMNFPVEYTILMRKYFDAFINAETKYAREIGTTVGVNIYSSQWDSIYTELHKFKYHLDGDYKGFDGTIRPEFFKLYSNLVNSFYKDENANIRDMLMQGCCFAPIFVLDKVYIKQKGNPSGSRTTTSFNSFVNRMYVVMSMLDKLPAKYHTTEFFNKNLKMYAHGDDHLLGFSDIIESYWDGLKLRDFMAAHNIGYTSSKKDQPLVPHCRLENCFYLKSWFVYDTDTGKVKCGLDKSVIQEMVSWQRDTDLISTDMIIKTSLRYAYFWGRSYFDINYIKIKTALLEKKINIKLPYYDDLENEYNYSGQLEFSYINM